MPTVKKDIRDSQKISTLPGDLRSIANEILEEKFDLAKQGEVVEDPKAERDVTPGATEDTETKDVPSPFDIAREYDLREAEERRRRAMLTDRRRRLHPHLEEAIRCYPIIEEFVREAEFEHDRQILCFNLQTVYGGRPCGFYIDLSIVSGWNPADLARYIMQRIEDCVRMAHEPVEPRRYKRYASPRAPYF